MAFAARGLPRQTAVNAPASGTQRDLDGQPHPWNAFSLETALLVLLGVLAGAALAVLVARRFGGRRQRAMTGLLDAADALEARLRAARAEIAAVAGDDQADPVGAAMREMLRQRLWLQEHGSSASIAELQTVRDSIDAARLRIEHQLSRIERARAPLA